MSTVVAGLFDSQADATEVMDRILQARFPDAETRVVEGGSRDSTNVADRPGVPLIPNTSGEFGGTPANFAPGWAIYGLDRGWLKGMGDVESAFYFEGLREGATLAMVKVEDDQADSVRQIMREHGARTYTQDQ